MDFPKENQLHSKMLKNINKIGWLAYYFFPNKDEKGLNLRILSCSL